MDVLEKFLTGETSKESRPVHNPGNLRPPGASTGFQQFKTAEEGIQAADRNLKAYGDKGINTLRGVISRWAPSNENDTNAYINYVAKNVGINPDDQIDLSDPVQRHVLSGAMFRFEQGPKIFKSGKAKQAEPTSVAPTVATGDPLERFLSGAPISEKPGEPETPEAKSKPTTKTEKVAQKLATDAITQAQKVAQAKEQLTPESVASGLDILAGGVTSALQLPGYWAGRAFGLTPEESKAASGKITEPLAQPVGRITGVSETPAYQQSLPSKIAEKVGEKAEQYIVKPIAEKTGQSPIDVEMALGTIAAALPAKAKIQQQFAKLKTKPPLGEQALTPAPSLATDVNIPPAQRAAIQAKMTAEPAAMAPADIATMQAQFEAKRAGMPVPTEKPVVPVAPVATQLEEQKAAKGMPSKPFSVPEENPPMPEAPLPKNEIAAREDALRKVGITEARLSALENNPKEASSQFITSQASQEPYGQGMTNQINYEKGKLDNHFADIEKQSGGHVVRYGTENQVADEIRVGQTIKNSIQKGYDAWVKEGNQLYKDAEKAHGGKPVDIKSFADYLANDANFAYEAENSLKNGINNYLKRAGLMDKSGNISPMSVSQAEDLRKYINSKYNPQSYGVSKAMKNMIDNDVFQQVGGETYQKARLHWGKGKDTYENPKAMGDLLADKGVNEKIRDERVMNTMSALPQKQFNHILRTLREDNQLGAVHQIQTSLTNEIRRAGQSGINQPYNSIAAAKKAAELSEKLRVAFADNPKLLQKIYDGIEAGNIIHIPSKYPGAAVQTHLLKNKFSEMAIQKGATTIGGAGGAFVGGAVGAGAGALGGEMIGGKITEGMRAKRQAKQLGKEIKTISDMTKE